MQKVTAFKTEPKGAYFKMVDEHIFLFGMMARRSTSARTLAVRRQLGRQMATQRTWQHLDGRRPDPENRAAQTGRRCRSDFGSHTNSFLVYLLAHADQRIRLEAQFELARRDRFDELLGLATNPNGDRLARVHAMGLGQLDADQQRDKRLAKRLPFADNDAEIRAQAAKLAGTRVPPRAQADGPAHDKSAWVRFHAAMALAKRVSLNDLQPDCTPRAQQRQGLHPARGYHGLTGSAEPEQLIASSSHGSAAVRVRGGRLRRLRHTGAEKFLNDENKWVFRECQRDS